MTVLMMAVTMVPGMAFAAASDGFERTLDSPAGGGFRIEDSATGELVKDVTITMLSSIGAVMGKTVCADGQSFSMKDIEKGIADKFEFKVAGYKTFSVASQNGEPNLGIGKNWYNKDQNLAYNIKAGTVKLEADVSGIHTLSGKITVTDSATGESVAGAIIELADRNTSSTMYSQKLDADGNFSISNIAPGSYGWRVSAEGYISSQLATSGMGALANTTTAQNRTLTQSVVLVKETKGSASISGRVTDKKSGSAVKGVSVQLMKGSEASGTAVTTADDGTYSISKVEAGTYTLEASVKGYKKAVTDSFEVADGAVLENRDIVIEEEVSVVISGKVTDENGNVINAYIPVALYDENGKAVSFAAGSASTINGEFTLGTKSYGGVGPGKYTVKVDAKGYLIQSVDITVNEDGSYDDIWIRLKEDPVKDATIGGTIYKYDNGSWVPLANSTVSVQLLKNGKVFQGPMSSSYNDGTYKFKGYSNSSLIKAGTYVVEVKTSGTNSAAKSVPIEIEDKTVEQVIIQDIYIGAADMTDCIVTGKVTAGGKDGGKDLKAVLMKDGTAVTSEECDENGRFIFTGVQPGKYTVKASAAGCISQSSDEFELSAGTSLCGVDLTVHKLGIRISSLPEKTVYKKGELLDPAGLVVEAYYDDDEENSRVLSLKDESSDDSIGYVLSGYALSSGKNTITVSYTEGDTTAEATFDVTMENEQGQTGTTDDSGKDQDGNDKKVGKNNGGAAGEKAGKRTGNHAETGDAMELPFVIALLALSGIAAASVLIMRKRTEDKN